MDEGAEGRERSGGGREWIKSDSRHRHLESATSGDVGSRTLRQLLVVWSGLWSVKAPVRVGRCVGERGESACCDRPPLIMSQDAVEVEDDEPKPLRADVPKLDPLTRLVPTSRPTSPSSPARATPAETSPKATRSVHWNKVRAAAAVICGWHPSRLLPEDEAEQSFADQCLEKNSMWAYMGLDGLEGFEKPFATCLADLAKAKQQAQLESCTRVRVRVDDASGEDASSWSFRVLSPFGAPLRSLDRFPFWRREIKRSESTHHPSPPLRTSWAHRRHLEYYLCPVRSDTGETQTHIQVVAHYKQGLGEQCPRQTHSDMHRRARARAPAPRTRWPSRGSVCDPAPARLSVFSLACPHKKRGCLR